MKRHTITSCLFALLAAVFCGCVSVPDGEPFRIMSYNIRHGEGMDGKLDLSRIGRRISETSPRFAGLQEVDMRTSRVRGADTCATLERETGLHATFAKAITFGGGEYGNALLSREAPKSVRRIPLPGAEPRVLLLCEFDDCWVGVTHLAVDSVRARLDSLPIVEEAVAACAPKSVFLMGDWNASPRSQVLEGMRKFMTVLSDERGATFHNGRTDAEWLSDARHCIDYVAVDSAHCLAYDVREARTIPDYRASDHAPVVVEVVPCGGAFAADATEPRVVGISDNGTGGVRKYIDAVEAAGHVPVVIGLTTDTNRLAKAVAKIDVLLLTGGEDVEPSRYGAVRSGRCGKVNVWRDAYDFALLAAARERHIPIAGICRGMQLMNVAFGGTLYQDLPTEFRPTAGVAQCPHRKEEGAPAHTVSIAAGSRLAAAIGTEPLAVNSHHHQAVKKIAPGFRVTATAPDGVIEAFESDEYPAVGVQFHPEKLIVSGAEAKEGFDRRRLMNVISLLCGQGKAFGSKK